MQTDLVVSLRALRRQFPMHSTQVHHSPDQQHHEHGFENLHAPRIGHELAANDAEGREKEAAHLGAAHRQLKEMMQPGLIHQHIISLVAHLGVRTAAGPIAEQLVGVAPPHAAAPPSGRAREPVVVEHCGLLNAVFSRMPPTHPPTPMQKYIPDTLNTQTPHDPPNPCLYSTLLASARDGRSRQPELPGRASRVCYVLETCAQPMCLGRRTTRAVTFFGQDSLILPPQNGIFSASMPRQVMSSP